MLLRDLIKGEDTEIAAILAIVGAVQPDVLTLTQFDYDYDQLALAAFAEALGYPHYLSAAPNTGVPTGYDIDGNGRLGEARDAQGYGWFFGDGGMAVLSRYPLEIRQDLSGVLWRDLPGAVLPTPMSDDVAAVQRLSTTGHWVVTVTPPDGAFDLLVSAHTPPVFDGPEDRNGLRNRDELALWKALLDGHHGPPPKDFVIAGLLNLDPLDGDGLGDALTDFLGDPRLQDPLPQSIGGQAAADATHLGDPALDTADWPSEGPGNLRVSYVLPSMAWRVEEAGVFWPAKDTPQAALLGEDGLAAGPHRLVWVDVSREPA